MIKKRTHLLVSLTILLLGIVGGAYASPAADDCHSLMLDFLAKAEKKIEVKLLSTNWSQVEKNTFLADARKLGFSDDDINIIVESLNLQATPPNPSRVKNYLIYVLSLKANEQKAALMDLSQLDSREMNSKFITKFLKTEDKIQAKIKSKKLVTQAEKDRFQELYYGCRALRPNEINKNAAKSFKKFNFSLSLGTLGASYAYYNMDKDFNAEWFEKLGYDVGVSLLFSYVGGKIQTNASDTQITKSLKNYFMGRVLGVTDILIYDPLFNKEREKAQVRLEKLKKDPNYQQEIAGLLKSYEERSLYRKYKEEVINSIKKLPEGFSFGLKGNSVDENNVDWNNLSYADLDRPEVQDVLLAASMAQVYQDSKGEWIDTNDAGLDRYVFNTIYYGTQIPKSIFQNFRTYQMLCMGQDNPKIAFTKAVLFNVTSNFLVNQALFGYRHKAIGQ